MIDPEALRAIDALKESVAALRDWMVRHVDDPNGLNDEVVCKHLADAEDAINRMYKANKRSDETKAFSEALKGANQ